jgi:anti-anti-sigma factor
MVDTAPVTPARPTVVTLPAEIDLANADAITGQLIAALGTGARVVIADMTATTFCDTLGIRSLLRAWQTATARGGELRLLLPAPGVLRVMKLLGVDNVLPVYYSLEEALAGTG